MRIYDEIATEYQTQNDFETALVYYEKCLSTTKNAKDLDKQAMCHYKIGIIRE